MHRVKAGTIAEVKAKEPQHENCHVRQLCCGPTVQCRLPCVEGSQESLQPSDHPGNKVKSSDEFSQLPSGHNPAHGFCPVDPINESSLHASQRSLRPKKNNQGDNQCSQLPIPL